MHPSYTSKFPELGFYGLPGHSRTPRDILKPVSYTHLRAHET